MTQQTCKDSLDNRLEALASSDKLWVTQRQSELQAVNGFREGQPAVSRQKRNSQVQKDNHTPKDLRLPDKGKNKLALAFNTAADTS